MNQSAKRTLSKRVEKEKIVLSQLLERPKTQRSDKLIKEQEFKIYLLQHRLK